jgi:hypothetical protein
VRLEQLAQFALEKLAARVLRQRIDKTTPLGTLKPPRRLPQNSTTSFSLSDWPCLVTITAVTASIQRECGSPTTDDLDMDRIVQG